MIGGLVKYFHYGARGAEIIPNYTFWKDFPFLVKVNVASVKSIYLNVAFFQNLYTVFATISHAGL